MKHYTIDDAGNVSEVGPFSRGMSSPEVQARNKTEATAALLKIAKVVLAHSPRLVIRNGAFLLVHHNGDRFVAESGPLDLASSPLCLSGHSTEREALEKGASFAYYSSDEYQNQHKAS